jgi:hypothetical protein
VADNSGSSRSASRAVLVYNLCRLGLLVVCLGLGWLAGIRNWLVLIVVALLVSGLLSWFLLRQQRTQMGEAVERAVARSQARMGARTAAEDAYVDSVLASSPSPATEHGPSTSGEQPPP